MKVRPILLAGVLAFGAGLPAQEKISPNDMPEAVRLALYQLVGSEPVKEVTREVVDGRPTYRVELERENAINPRLRFAETGELLTERAGAAGPALDPAAPAPVIYGPSPAFDELPAAVQETVLREARGRVIVDLDREIRDGRTVYAVAFRAEGINPRIHVAADGRLLDGSPANPSPSPP